jgi:hypothetical protein
MNRHVRVAVAEWASSFKLSLSFPRRLESRFYVLQFSSEAPCHNNAAGSRPGGRVTFLLHDKKVTKETCPATSALRATRCCEARNGRSRKLAAAPLRHAVPDGPISRVTSAARRKGGERRIAACGAAIARSASCRAKDRKPIAMRAFEFPSEPPSEEVSTGEVRGRVSEPQASLRHRPGEAFAARAARRAGEAGAAAAHRSRLQERPASHPPPRGRR